MEPFWESPEDLRKHSRYEVHMNLTHYQILTQPRENSVPKTLRHRARICASIQIFSTVLALPEKTGQDKASSSEINSPVSDGAADFKGDAQQADFSKEAGEPSCSELK